MYLCSFSTDERQRLGLPTFREWKIRTESKSIGDLYNGNETVNIGQPISSTLKHG